MQAGVAYCDAKVPFAAGFQLARDAATQANIAEVAVLLLFCSATTDYQRLLDGARQYCGGNTIIIGGSAVGVITNQHIVSTGQPAVAMAISATDVQFQAAVAEQLSRDPYVARVCRGARCWLHPAGVGRVGALYADLVAVGSGSARRRWPARA